MSTSDEQRSGRPVSVRTDLSRAVIEQLVDEDRRGTLLELERACGIEKRTVYRILRNELHLSKIAAWSAVGPDFLFIDDSARLHRSFKVSDKPQIVTILRMLWSAYLPDLNRIEHTWDVLDRGSSQRIIPHRTVQELNTALREKWDKVPQEFLDSLVKIMENRCKMCNSVNVQ
ncbi:transposable element Tc1 transposase [Trichonephila inaurata madagascariensis]|uniref:Transposable element Tc1 transposase n=1 Tax=Trichonephila inaurata madagascariensis TaxID=2747483 RepID=A0A8X6WRU8_9ARAC|nr:transposable element Tc1 transposase [Trichonephila inaurata madagascariensis]